MVAQMEVWLENLLFITGNARAEAAHLQEQRQLARGAQAGHAEWRAQVLARAIRASWAGRWSALGRSGAPAVPRGRSGRTRNGLARARFTCTWATLVLTQWSRRKKGQKWAGDENLRQNVALEAA